MLDTRQTGFKKVILTAALLASLILTACVGPRGWPGAQVADNVLYVGTLYGTVLALNAENGRMYGNNTWEWKPTVEQGAGIAAGNVTGAFLSCSRGGVGQFKAGYLYGSPLISNGTVYIGYHTGVVYALDATKGVEIWKHDIKSNIAAGLVFDSNTVYVGSTNGKVSALNAGNGSLKWDFTSENEVRGAPAVADGIVYFGSLDHKLYALDAIDGTKLWAVETEGEIASAPLVVDGVIYFGSFDSKFYAIDSGSGAIKWVFDKAGNWFWSRALYDDGIVYAASIDNRVYALDAGNGTLRWPEPFDAGSPLKASPVIASGVLVLASKDGKVFGLDLKTGREKWSSIDLGAKVLSDLCTDGQIIYINDQNGRIYALDGETGQIVWTETLADLDR